jgi:hypothetical protein
MSMRTTSSGLDVELDKKYKETLVEKKREVEMPRRRLYCPAIAGDISDCGVGILLVKKRGRR